MSAADTFRHWRKHLAQLVKAGNQVVLVSGDRVDVDVGTRFVRPILRSDSGKLPVGR